MVEPVLGMRVYHEGYELSGHIERFGINGAIVVMWDEPSTLHDGVFLPAKDRASAWHDGILHPLDEQPKPTELGCFRVGDRVVTRWEVTSLSPTYAMVQLEGTETQWRFETRRLHHDTASAPPLPISKRDTLPAPPHCSHCADNAGMLDAACKRLGDREVELASALRAVDRLAAELRDERNRRRYR